MLNSYFGFSCSPFENTLDQQFLFVSECHEEVIAALLYFIQDKKSFALVCGDVGTGKTMLIHHILTNLPESVLPILIPYPDVEYIEILRYIARALGVDPEGKGTLELTDELKAALVEANLGGKQVVLIIDEAHLLSESSLENIRLVSNIETTENKLLKTLLIGQNELSHKLRGREMRQFRQRININRVLNPMSPSETIEYIDHRLKIAGSSFDTCFEPGCMKPLYKMTGGVPRNINQLCDTALLICMNEERDRVTKKILSEAQDEIESDMIRVPGAPESSAFFLSKRLKPAFAASALILLLILVGVFGYGLKAWFYGADVRKEVNAALEKEITPAPVGKTPGNPPPPTGKNDVSGRLSDPGTSTAVSPTPAAPQVPSAEGRVTDKMDRQATANEKVVSPNLDAGSGPATPKKAVHAGQIADINHKPTQIDGEGAGQVAGSKTGTPHAAVHGAKAEEATSGSSDFIAVSVKKGESLNQIAALLFPADPESGKKSLLTANPQIDNENRFLMDQILRLPRPGAATPIDK